MLFWGLKVLRKWKWGAKVKIKKNHNTHLWKMIMESQFSAKIFSRIELFQFLKKNSTLIEWSSTSNIYQRPPPTLALMDIAVVRKMTFFVFSLLVVDHLFSNRCELKIYTLPETTLGHGKLIFRIASIEWKPQCKRFYCSLFLTLIVTFTIAAPF